MYSLWGWGYVGSYSMTNSDEYFANGLMTYFDVQYPYDEVIENVKTVCMVDFPRQLQQLGRSCSKWTPSLQPSWTGSPFQRWKNVQTVQTRLCYFFSLAVLIFWLCSRKLDKTLC